MLSQERWWRWVASLRDRSVPGSTGTVADCTEIGEQKSTSLPGPHIAHIERTLEFLSRAQAYGAGLTRYRARDFAAAAEQFARVADEDPPSALFLERARQLAQQPPGPDWEPVSAQEEK